jgi:hypothetical protein
MQDAQNCRNVFLRLSNSRILPYFPPPSPGKKKSKKKGFFYLILGYMPINFLTKHPAG